MKIISFVRVFIVAAFIAWPAFPADQKLKSELKFKTRDLEKVQSELKKKEQETQKIMQESMELSNEMSRNKLKMNDVQLTIENTGLQTKEVQNRIAKTKNEKDNLTKRYFEQSQNICHLSAQYYLVSAVMGNSNPVPVYMRQVIRGQNKTHQNLKQEKSQTEYEFDELIQTQNSLQEEYQRQRKVLEKLKSSYSQQTDLLKKKETKRQIIEQELKDLKQTAQELTSMIDLLRTKEKQASEDSAKQRIAKQTSGQSPVLSHSLSWPVQGVVIEKFGKHNHPEFGTPYTSNGIRIKLGQEASVKSVSGGRVLFAGNFLSFGAMILVEHPGDWYSVYGHLGSLGVIKGQELTEGQTVGTSGLNEKGNQEVYFELRFYGKPVDPLPWLKD